MKRLFLFAKQLNVVGHGVYFTQVVPLYSSTFNCCYIVTVMTIFLDIHPMGRAVAKLENKKKT